MAPHSPTLLLDLRHVPVLGLAAWAQTITQAFNAGSRLVTLLGRSDGKQVVLTAVLQSEAQGLQALRAQTEAGTPSNPATYPSLTAHHPAAQMLERELWEQTGVVPIGHPWLKPVRFEGARQQQMHSYPFFSMRGQAVHEVGVGPVHAGVIEPGHFRFMCHGEQVQHLEIQLGYQHRGVQALLQTRPPLLRTPLVETAAGDTSIAYAWGYCAAVEALAGVQLAPEVNAVRGVALELERIAMHLVALTGLATDIAFLQGGTSYGRLRTAIINLTQRLCGNRFGRGWLRPGGVRHGIDTAQQQDLQQTLAAFAKDMKAVNALMWSARSVRARFEGTGTVPRAAAQDIGLVGLAARASGVALDTRHSLPGALYTAHPLPLLTESCGDCWARLRLRQREIDASLQWMQRVLPTLSAQGQPPPTALGALAAHTLCVTVKEGFRGPVVQALETGAAGEVLQHKLQDPSLLNWFGLAMCLRDNDISDFPLCNKSFDLSYCGNDL